MQETTIVGRAVSPSRVRRTIAELESARTDAARHNSLAKLIELALSGTLSERHEATAHLEANFGCTVAGSSETISVH